jgi:hypothetical protein
MNDMTLCKAWKIPTYAQAHLKITTDTGNQYSITGEQGNFTLKDTPSTLTVDWGDAPLTQLAWATDSLNWTGAVRVGGFVTSIHMTELQAIDMPLAIITIEAHPLKPSVMPFLSARQRANRPYPPSDCLDGIDDETQEGVTTWIAEIDSPLTGVMQDAMNQGHRIYSFGQLASEEQGWHSIFALPILLESVTTFMS